MTNLQGRVAFVTGGARGQGRAHALALARAGADISICDISKELGTVPYPTATEADRAETVRLVEAEDRRCQAYEADVSNSEEINAAVTATVETYGHLDIVIANAGICGFGAFSELSDSEWDETIAVNLTGVFKTLRAAVPFLVQSECGRVVVTSSMGGRQGAPNLAHYCASKWGVIGLVKTLALELSESGVTVNAVAPTTVNSNMIHNPAFYGLFAPGASEPDRAQVEPLFAATNPMKVPWLDPAEIANAALFLVSDEARYVSGHVLEVAAGASALTH